MKKTMALVTIGNQKHEITNVTLNKSLNEMIKCMDNMNKNSWTYAYHLYNICEGELFADDFHDLTRFANFIGMSKSSVTQYSKAVEFAKKHGYIDCIVDGKLAKNDFARIPFNLGIGYLLSTIDSYDVFLIWLDETQHFSEAELFRTTVKTLRALIKAYNKRYDAQDAQDAQDAPITKGEVIINILDAMTKYNISLNELGTAIAARASAK